MIRKILLSFTLALQNIRSNFFHTILSILGIVIGVATLVGILSLIDGAEEFARKQISQTTSLNAIIVQTEQFKRVNEIRVRKDSFEVIDFEDYLLFKSRFNERARVYLRSTASDEINSESDTLAFAALIYGSAENLKPNVDAFHGRLFAEEEIANKSLIAVINYKAASIIAAGDNPEKILGERIKYLGEHYSIVGILNDKDANSPEIFIPITTLLPAELRQHPPILALEAKNTEEVPEIRQEVSNFLFEIYGNKKDDFTIVTNEFRVEQARQGFLLFRVIMGIIVGISVLVGGIGVMNVLLISVTERTSEIGIRKAVGANQGDIVLQFMCEALTVSTLGSIAGLIVGIFGTVVAVPIIRMMTKAPFQAAFTANTLIVVSLVALAVGFIFGTYPAFRASKLEPVEAIRRE